MPITTHPQTASTITRDYLCSDCWQPLHQDYDSTSKLSTVICSTPGCPCNGYIRKGSADIMRAQSKSDKMDAEAALAEAGAWISKARREAAKLSNDQLINQLGF